MTTMEMAALLGVNPTTVSKVAMRHLRETGTNAPGHHGMNNYTEEYAAWFNSRPDGRSFRRGPQKESMPLYPAPEPSRVLVTEPPEVDTPVKPPLAKAPQSAHVQAQITGLTPASRKPDYDALWERAIAHQTRAEDKADLRYKQRIDVPDTKPILLVLLSDLHLGNAHADYSAAKRDAELVRDTPGCYAALLGDLVDSWITPKLQYIQREQPFPYADELALLESWLAIMEAKLIAVVAGNHDLRTYQLAGLDLLGNLLQNVRTLYDQHEIAFTLGLGEASWRWKLRHAFARRSQYNPTHGAEFDSKFLDGHWDVAVSGHTHSPTCFREFFDNAYDHKVKLAVQLGSYQLDSSYGRQLNLGRCVPGGSAAIMMWPDGRMQPWRDLGAAARFLSTERGHA